MSGGREAANTFWLDSIVTGLVSDPRGRCPWCPSRVGNAGWSPQYATSHL